ncbi:nicotinic acid mononucleotide adenylyltransferase [Candidatus Pantoea edessiphila]|uniref:Probable nicotinate-nucleotide adenylyltransferase n=1 Tax=Candidatus Pantoea edessiphila TaxID=2044610 RepID=A0A2P5SZ25_9GAMM|nr:nicotinate-nucleotide adenylyltransferase [Candidatus Pantoea edessiphila]PPI87575.1 nicotinic acid mononucleotide adenylyltransferase [Candidatus Pantoea edessiphila]
MCSKLHAVFGGTFDPIHFGHLLPVKILASQIGLKSVIIIPNNIPPHRLQPEASALQRVKMLKFATKKEPLFKIDTRELRYKIPSWTVYTIENLRAELGHEKSLVFIIGFDSLLNLTKWYRWQDLLSLCHIVVCNRSEYLSENQEIQSIPDALKKYIISDIKKLYLQQSGYIWLADTPYFNISSTEIKLLVSQKKKCDHLLPKAVIEYIFKCGLYSK